MIFTETYLTSETSVLTMSVALTLQILRLNNLTTSLVFKLIIFTEKLEAEAASETSPPVVPDTSLTLDALRISEDTGAGVTLETLLPVTHPRLAEITYSTNHLQSCGVVPWMLDHTVTSLHHTLLFTTLCTHG